MRFGNWRSVRILLAGVAAALVGAAAVMAGPPLICHAFDIGEAKSLPFVGHDWNLSGAESYDTKSLAADTVAILDANPSTLVHMETLRRATLYGRKDPQAAKQLLLKLAARAEATQSSAKPSALAVFDEGYLAETYKQWMADGQNPASGVDGYALVKKALALRGPDSEMEFAAALITLQGPAAEHQEHAAKAIAGSKSDELLEKNLRSHFLGQSQTMAEMITRGGETKVARE